MPRTRNSVTPSTITGAVGCSTADSAAARRSAPRMAAVSCAASLVLAVVAAMTSPNERRCLTGMMMVPAPSCPEACEVCH